MIGRLSHIFPRLASAVTTAAVLSGMLSCERRPLEDQDFNTDIRVRVNVNAIANVTMDVYNDKIPLPKIDPEVMHVLFFDKGTENVVSEAYINDISTEEGQTVFSGKLSIVPGDYEMLIYNFGTESTLIRDPRSFSKAEAYTNTVSDNILSRYKSKTGENEAVVYEPDHLLVASSENEVIPYHQGVYTVHAEARSIVESYYLQIKVDGLQYVSGAQAFLSGMNSANFIARNEKVEDPAATVYFNLVKSDDKGVPVICAVFNTFGRIENSSNELAVTFDLRTTDGRTVKKTFDLSELFLSEACVKHHWLLLDETITIDPPENPGTGGGGFEPDIDDWNEEHRDIEI